MKTKILYIVSSLRKAGPIIVLQNLIRHLDRDRFEVAIVKLCEDEPQRSITHQFVEEGIQVYEIGSSKKSVELFPKRIAKKVDNIVEEFKPDIIHTHGYQAVRVAINIKKRIPIIETLHNISGEDYILNYGKMLGTYMNFMYHRALTKIQWAAAISIGVEKYYRENIPSLQLSVIPNGVQDIPKDLPSKETIRREMNLETDSIVFSVVASITHRKDPITIIRAFQEAFPNGTNDKVRLFFIGKGPLEEECKRVIGTDCRIKLLGWHPDSYRYIRMADWTVSASHSEGFGMNFIESLMIGTPVISTEIEAFKDFKSFFPQLNDFKFMPEDVNKLASLMRKAISTKIDGNKLQTEADRNYSSEIMAKRYMDLYSKLSKEA